MIDEALDHVADRYRHENAILTNIRKARDEAEDPEHKRQAAELVDIVKDCIRRHTQLQSRLLEAGPLFRAEQDRQAFARPTAGAGLDLYGQLLAPLLPLPVRAGDPGHRRVLRPRAPDCAPPSAVRVGDLVDLLLTPPVEREHLGAEMPEPDLIATPDDSRFSEEQLASAMELLDLEHDAPRRLSGLLAEARLRDPELPYLVALLAVHAASPPVGTAYRQGEERLLFAVDDGTELDDRRVRRGRPDSGHGPAGRGRHGRGPHGGGVSARRARESRAAAASAAHRVANPADDDPSATTGPTAARPSAPSVSTPTQGAAA